MSKRFLAALLAVAAVVCVGFALRVDAAPSGDTEPGSSTPAWSPRRVPGPLIDGIDQLRLRAEIVEALAGTESCIVVDGPPGRIVDHDASRPLVPASTIKVLTAVGALTSLPDDRRFTTTVEAVGTVAGATVSQVALIGDADPLLGTPEWIAARAMERETAGTPTTPLADLADDIVAGGIRSIPGGVVGVAPRWASEPTFLDTWAPDYRARAIGPVSSLVVNGGFRAPGEPVEDGPLFAAEELGRLLRERGVDVGEPSTASAISGGEVLASVDSVPLEDVIGEMLATSDNLTAEILIREIATEHGESSTASGVAIVRQDLAALGLPVAGLEQVDGSGLSLGNRVPCELLSSALALAARPELAAVREGLAVAGEHGTLAPRLVGTPLAGRLQGKTGTLPGVSGLVGYLEVGPPLRFAMLANGDFSQEAAFPLRDEIAQTLARYPESRAANDLVPLP